MLENIYQLYLKHCKQISIDSRTIQKGDFFFALRGKAKDGNQFAAEALRKGASYAIIDNPIYQESCKEYIFVKDSLKTLQGLAYLYRKNFTIPIIGITGSNGKTTTKELTASVLSKEYKVFATSGNLNNHIGVPLSILSMPLDTEIGVFELGANQKGDIKLLCNILCPTHGVITSIGKAHLEGFGSIQGVLKTKTELYEFLHAAKGKIFLNTNCKTLQAVVKKYKQVINFPNEDNFYHVKHLENTAYVTYYCPESKENITTNLLGDHHFQNISAALCIAKFFNIPLQKAHQSIVKYQPNNNRSQIIKHKSNVIILDAYNANPNSMQASIKAFHKMELQKKIMILGDMAELGSQTRRYHKELGRFTEKYTNTRTIFVGPSMYYAHQMNRGSLHFTSKELIRQYLKNQEFKNTLFLLKSSRTMELETLVEVLKK